MVACSKLSWLLVRFPAHVIILHAYRIVWLLDFTEGCMVKIEWLKKKGNWKKKNQGAAPGFVNVLFGSNLNAKTERESQEV